ncbi:MAG: biopolymer transporter ExbD [Gammaproteobacteria bacterium]|nr:biopolymer transporter ExbD [Gammaproteobacteria bacterium]MCF6362118.1 biopolymer transporter ExbD [Gammaproteobacteria bacterium]
MNIASGRKEELDVNITPLIDVVFLLLIFFMVSTTFERESEIEIVLPQAAANVVPADDFALEVTVDAEGTFYVNGKRVINSKIETLKKAMQEMAGEHKEPPIILSADAQTPHQAVITVMDAARQLGFVHLNFATVKSNEEK